MGHASPPPRPMLTRLFSISWLFWTKFAKQVCIPVGCVLAACCPYLQTCTAQGVCSRGVCCSQGVSTALRGGGCLLPGGVSPGGSATPPCEQNVKTLPCRNFVADGKHKLTFPIDFRPHSP